MSLINDALKRAHQNQPPPVSPPGAPLVAVPVAGGKNKTGWLLPMLVVGLVGASGFFFWKWQQFGTTTAHLVEEQVAVLPSASVVTAPPAAPAHDTPETVAPESASAVARSIAAGPVPVASIPAPQPAPVAQPASQPAVAVAVPEPQPAAPVPLKLQAILFRLKNPTAIVNGRTLSIGQKVDGATLLDIQRSLVVVERAGRRETLELP